MSELEAQDTYVLLYDCYNDESLHGGGDNVVLKFLPSKHPFARLLLHDGSRQRKKKVPYANSTTSASGISTLRFHDSRPLKDTIMSLSEAEVNEVLIDFCETQAHQQTSLFKSELLAHFV